jgi:hypothetical protein
LKNLNRSSKENTVNIDFLCRTKGETSETDNFILIRIS